MTRNDDTDLDALFAQARATPPEPSMDLLARVQADALAAQPVAKARVPENQSIWNRFGAFVQEQLGGWPTVAGLASVAVAGVVIGAGDLTPTQDVLASFVTSEETLSIDPLDGFDLVMWEG